MVKAVALRDLRIEEGIFAKGDSFAPGWAHFAGDPVRRILHLNCGVRVSQLLQTKDIMVLDLEEDEDQHPAILAEINEERRVTYNGILQHVPDVLHDLPDSDPDTIEDQGTTG